MNLFAPFTVGINKNGSPSIKKSITEAAIMDVKVNQTGASDSVIDLEFIVHRQTSDYRGVFYTLTTTNKTTLQEKVQIGQNNFRTLDQLVDQGLAQATLNSVNQIFVPGPGDSLMVDLHIDNDTFTNPPETTGADRNKYKDFKVKKYLTGLQPDTTYYLSVWAFNGDKTPEGISYSLNKSVHTAKKDTRDDNQYEVTSVNTTGPDSALPQCWISITEGWSMSGCIAQFIYYLFFVPTSYLFALTGVFFDWTFHYSIQSSSYESSFVLEGWGVVRDFCNIFFIFVLLYIAFRTILGMSGGHGPNTKQMIINVVIIGLLINFSLFAAQLIIDSSNILARVFYNSDAIKITKNGANGVTNSTSQLDVGPNGEIPLSAALVNKVNPQNLIIKARQVGNIEDKAGKSNQTVQSNTGVSNGTFILVTLLAIAVNVVGLIVFISVGIMFIARVIGLWLYMIFAPLAFFSYTVPQMQGLKMIGWKNWWSQLLCLSFWAPLFMFFLYLILRFLETGFDLIKAGEKDGLQFVISIIVPFAFIMLLLWRAKNLAKTMGCEVATQITGGVAAVGGLALGGAALGAAALGRNTLGAFMKGGATGDTAGQRARDGTSKNMYDNLKGKLFNVTGVDALQRGIGRRIDRDQKNVEKGEHARKTLNDTAQARYHKNYGDLTMTERGNVHDTIDRDIVSRQQYGNKKYSQLTNAQQTIVNNMVAAQRATTAGVAHGAAETVRDSKTKQSLGSKVLQSTRTGSYDIRNMSKIETKEHDTVASKFASGTTSFLANQMRGIFKQSNINYGTGQKDFLKDLGNTITDALKSTAVKVDLSHVGEEKKEDGHGGHH